MAKRKAKPKIARKPGGRLVALLELSLIGSTDGVPVELTGHGKFDAGAGRFTLKVRVARPLLLFDPALVAISLVDVLALAALGQRLGPGSETDPPVHFRSRTDLYDENGCEAGGWRVVAAVRHSRGAGLRLDGQLLDGHQRIEPGERVVAVDEAWTVMAQPLAPEGVLTVGAWDARTGSGNGYRGVTTTATGGSWRWLWAGANVVQIGVEGIDLCSREIAGEEVAIVMLASIVKALQPKQ